MRLTKISEHLWCASVWLVIPIRIWLAEEEDGVTLIDAGIGPMARGILKCIDALQAGPLKRIVLTHGHADHIGAIERIREKFPVPVYAHPIEMPYLQGEKPYPGRKKAQSPLKDVELTPLAETEQEAGSVLVNGGSRKLQSIGSLVPYHTPGHSPGHVAYYHEQDNVLLAGDLFTSKKGKLRRPMPMFTANMQEAIRSGEIVSRLRPQRVEICHGKPVFQAAEQWADYLNRWSQRWA